MAYFGVGKGCKGGAREKATQQSKRRAPDEKSKARKRDRVCRRKKRAREVRCTLTCERSGMSP